MSMTLGETLVVLRQAPYNIAKLTIQFNGSGDSGSVDSIDIISVLDGPVDQTIPIGADLKEAHPELTTLAQWLDAWAYDLIESMIEFDWVNNEGGGGTIQIDLFTGQVICDAYANIMTTEDHHYDSSVEGDQFVTVPTEGEGAQDG